MSIEDNFYGVEENKNQTNLDDIDFGKSNIFSKQTFNNYQAPNYEALAKVEDNKSARNYELQKMKITNEKNLKYAFKEADLAKEAFQFRSNIEKDTNFKRADLENNLNILKSNLNYKENISNSFYNLKNNELLSKFNLTKNALILEKNKLLSKLSFDNKKLDLSAKLKNKEIDNNSKIRAFEAENNTITKEDYTPDTDISNSKILILGAIIAFFILNK